MQPTSPYRKKSIINKCIKSFVKNKYKHNYISISKTNITSNLTINKKNFLKINKKSVGSNIKVNGNFYIFNVNKIGKNVKETINKYNTKGIFLKSSKDCIDIDNYKDLKLARSYGI